MKKFLIAGFLCLAFSSAYAFNVILDGTGTNATGIMGLEICPGGGTGCGELWDVAFEFDDDHTAPNTGDIYATPTDQLGALNAAAKINAALGTSAAVTVGEFGTATSQVYYVPYLYNDRSCAQPGKGTCVAQGDGFFGWGALPVTDVEIALDSPVQIARFTQAVVASDVDGDGTPDISDPCPADPLDECNTAGSVAAEVDSATGGSVTTPNGNIVLDIDPGDLVADATLSVTETVFSNPAVDLSIGGSPGHGQAISFYTFEPDGLQFQSAITLTVLADLAGVHPNKFDDLDVYRLEDTTIPPDGVPDTFIPLGAMCTVIENPVTVFTGSCVVQLDHFSVYAPIVPLDTDGDGIADLFDVEADNCTEVVNVPQRDTDNDGYGNMCDPDFDQNGVVDPIDFSLLKSRFGQPGFPDQDLNGNGIVDPGDFSRLKSMFGQPPGPSGLAP
jgi:hypothetical protein